MDDSAPNSNRYYPPSPEVFTKAQKDINRYTSLKETALLGSVIIELDEARVLAISNGFVSDEFTYIDLMARATSLKNEIIEARNFDSPLASLNPRLS